MSQHAVPTVRIVSPVSAENPTGYIVVNQADYHHERHQLWVDPEAAEEAAQAGEQTAGAETAEQTADPASGAPAAAPKARKAKA